MAVGSGTTGHGYTTAETGKGWQRSGSSLQFLEIWQTWEVTPNPFCEDFYFDGFFVGAVPLELKSLEVKTLCTPEPGTLVLIGCALVAMAGVVRRKLR